MRSYDEPVQVREEPVDVRVAARLREAAMPVGQAVTVDAAVPRGDVETGLTGHAEAEGQGRVPGVFLWRGRLYMVRDVLAHWYERRAWWAESAALALHGQSSRREELTTQMPPSADREVWRVEASAGRSAGSGVYDLCRSGDGPDAWRLLRVSD